MTENITDRRDGAPLPDAERLYLEVLTRKYILVYYLELETDRAEVLKLDEHANVWKIPEMRPGVRFCFSEHIRAFSERFVVAERRFQQLLSAENISRQLSERPSFSFRFASIPNLQGNRHYEVQVLRVCPSAFDGRVIIVSEEIDDVINAEVRRKMEAEERSREEQNQSELLRALGRNYHAIFRIDLTSDSYTEISCSDDIRSYFDPNEPSASRTLRSLCLNVIAPQYEAHMLRFFDLSTLPQRLHDREVVEADCELRSGSWHRARFIAKRRGENGDVTHVLYVTQLIDDEKHYEESLIARAEYADYANRAKTEFISQVAHDIRTPMNSIFGFLEIAEANLDNPEKLRYSLEKIRLSGEFLKELVDDVLDISRMEHGKLRLQPKIVSVSEILNEFAASIQYAKAKKLRMRFDVHDIICDSIVADPLRIKQIYSNIISNAIKYTPEGGSISFSVCQAELPGGRVRLISTISDTGIGMSQEFMEKMFHKFERGTDTRINKVNGYGLGLTIVKQLVDLMGGTIDVRSTPGEGSCFCIALDFPCAQTEDKAEPPAPFTVCSGMRLLVAEDNALNREVISELLALHGIACDCAEDGRVCIERFCAAPEAYSAILMDMQMPNMNGIEATEALRRLPLPQAKAIPIIAMTANALSDDASRCLDSGMNAHLSKPVDMPQLLELLSSLLGQ